MQIVYISNRPDILNDTLKQVEKFMPFVDSAVVLCPVACKGQISVLETIPVEILFEEDLLHDAIQNISVLDHQTRNYLLRAKLIETEYVHDEFIMSDDDNRPIADVTLQDYKLNGKYRNYYFYDLEKWKYRLTDFDHGQRVTGILLRYLGLPHLSYASHMPQLINKEIFRESAVFFEKYAGKYPLCEWSTYFNYAHGYHSSEFSEPEAFRTLCWPDFPGTWPYYVRPGHFLFENYHPEMYEPGALFEGLSACPDKAETDLVTLEKLIRLDQVEAGRMKFSLHPCDPWRKKSFLHCLAVMAGRPFKKMLDTLMLEDKSARLSIERQLQSLQRNSDKR